MKYLQNLFIATIIATSSHVMAETIAATTPDNVVAEQAQSNDDSVLMFNFKTEQKEVIVDPLSASAEKIAEFVPNVEGAQEIYWHLNKEMGKPPMESLMLTYKEIMKVIGENRATESTVE